MKKLSDAEAKLKKVLAYERKQCIFIIFTDTVYNTLYNLLEIKQMYWRLRYMQCNTQFMMVSFHFLMITSKSF